METSIRSSLQEPKNIFKTYLLKPKPLDKNVEKQYTNLFIMCATSPYIFIAKKPYTLWKSETGIFDDADQ